MAEASKKVDEAVLGMAKSLSEESGQKLDIPDNLKELEAKLNQEPKKEEPK